jgi:hypothetical protein
VLDRDPVLTLAECRLRRVFEILLRHLEDLRLGELDDPLRVELVQADIRQQLHAGVKDGIRRLIVCDQLIRLISDGVGLHELAHPLREGQVELHGLHDGPFE